MTDEQMDARLQAAGERWRAATALAEAGEPIRLQEPAPHEARHPRRRWPLLASAAVIAAALVLGGTLLLRNGADTPRPSGDVAGLQGHVWLLTGVPGTHSSATLYIDQHGALVADDECRLIAAHAAVRGSTLTVSDAVTRDKPCTDQYPPGFFHGAEKFLDGTSSFRITADALIITKDGHADRFVPAPDQTPVPSADFPTLTGVQWQLTDATDASGRSVTVAPGQTLRLDPGKISASIGCAKFGTTISISGDRVVIGGHFAPVACLRDPVAAVLTGTVHVAVAGAQLTVAKGRARLVYRWMPAHTDDHDPQDFLDRTWHLRDGAGTALPAGTSFRATHDGFSTDERCSSIGALDVQPGSFRVSVIERRPLCTGSHQLDGVLSTRWSAWSVTGDRLLLFGAAQADPLVFGTAPPTPAPTSTQLDGTWDFVVPGASMAVSEQFTVSGRTITITHRCYVNRGTVSVTDGAMTVSDVHAFRAVPCPARPAAMSASERVFDARLDHLLAGAATWTVRNGVLTVTAQGVPAMRFERDSGR